MTRALALAVLLAAGAAQAEPWTVDAANSSLAFSGRYEGEPFDGRFRRFTPTVAVDATDPARTRIVVDVDMTSVDTADEDRDGTLRTPDFFWYDKYPTARFETTACRAAAGATAGAAAAADAATARRFVCAARLTIRDKTKTLDFPFTWTESGGTATLAASVTLNRLDYDVGTGDWADDALIAHDVVVTTRLALQR